MFAFSKTTTGTVLFALDTVLIATVWPIVLWLAQPDATALLQVQADARGFSYPIFDVLLLFAMGLYRRDAILQTSRSLTRAPLVVGTACSLAILLSVIQPTLLPGAPIPETRSQIMLFGLAIATFTLCAFFARLVIDVMVQRRILRRRIMVVGAGQRAWELLYLLQREGHSLHDDLTIVHEPGSPVDPRLRQDRPGRIVCPPGFDLVTAATRIGADLIVIALDERRGMNLDRLLECKKAGFPLMQYLTFVEREIRRIDLKRIELGWLVYTDGFTYGTLEIFLKRGFDLAVSTLVLLLTAPLIVGAMVAIRCESPGPIFYHQDRVTKNGRIFSILKLRTMRVNAESQGAIWAAQKDNRITRVGNFLRRARIDELPQLLNILLGEMSFVGPRPERPIFVKQLADKIPLYNERHMVKAGLTGWAQINYPYGASVDDARSKLSYDLYYVKNFSILFDFIILLQTLRVVLWPSGVR
jgi:sugar transferase (PEP-CTERM system associated)